MNRTPQSLPACPSPLDVEQMRQRWEAEAQKIVKEIISSVDDAEIFVKLVNLQGWSFAQQQLKPLSPPPQGEAYIRLFRGGHTVWGRYPLTPQLWQRGVRELVNAFPKESVGLYRPPKPTQHYPRLQTFDARFYQTLGEGYQLQRLAHAVSDNAWHEGERFEHLSKLHSVQGRVLLHLKTQIVCNGQGIVSDSHLHLEAAVRLNQHFEDRKQSIFTPASYLPWALMGASLWRKRAPLAINSNQSSGYREIILAPKVFEKILRQRLPFICTRRHFDIGAQVGANELTLTYEPKADGMLNLAPFDHLGRPRSPTPLILQGSLTAHFSIDPLGAQWSPQGLRPHFGTFFIRPGERTHSEMLNDIATSPKGGRNRVYANRGDSQLNLQVENATLEPPDERGTNGFSLCLTEAITSQHQLLAPGRYKLSGTVASTAEGPGLLEQIELSKEVVDTGTAILPYAKVRLYLHPS